MFCKLLAKKIIKLKKKMFNIHEKMQAKEGSPSIARTWRFRRIKMRKRRSSHHRRMLMELERAQVRAEAELRIHKHYRCAPLALPAEDLTAFAPAASRSRFEAAMLSGTIQVSTPSQVTRSSPAADEKETAVSLLG